MLRFTLAFLFGSCLLQQVATLPSYLAMTLLICAALLTLYRFKHSSWYLIVAGIMLGFSVSAWQAKMALSWILNDNEQDTTIVLKGIISSLPVNTRDGIRFQLMTNHGAVMLTWRHPHKRIVVGDSWNLPVKLKRIHFPLNPGSYNVEAWFLQKTIHARGYVDIKQKGVLVRHHRLLYPIERFRQKLRDKINAFQTTLPSSVWLSALIMGDRSAATEDDWQVLRKTGTNHLMAIAGLHIGILTALMYQLFFIIWRLSSRLLLILPAQIAATIASLLFAICYSLQSGFSLPAQRACFMLTALCIVVVRRTNNSIWHVFSCALFVVLFCNTMNTLTESFWLSFVTIALIIFGMRSRLQPRGLWWRWGRVQWVIASGLLPLGLLFYQECSLVSFLANCIAIPWLEFFVLPLCLLSGVLLCLSNTLGQLSLHLSEQSLAVLWWCLHWFAQLPMAVCHLSVPSLFLTFIMMLGCILLLLPRGIHGKWLGLALLLPGIFYHYPQPPANEYWLDLIDVGQGLSVLARTAHHTLLFDAGPKFSTQIDAGEQFVVPFLRYHGISNIDLAVISHGDNDHRGGMQAVINAFNIKKIISSVPRELPWREVSLCLAGQHWQWDGVNFTILYPNQDSLGFGNDSSCVLKIDNGAHATLITADIERFAEKRILNIAGSDLQADILIAPHHGSKTSSSNEFIHAINPQYVLYATGYRNRFHFPHPVVVTRYAERHVKQFNTADSGTISFRVSKKLPIDPPEIYREQRKRYWFN